MWLDPYEQTDFQLNASVTWHVCFIDRILKTPLDPDTVGMTTSAPLSGSPSAVAPVKDAVGVYHYDLPLTTVGRWTLMCQPVSGGARVGSGEITLQVFDAAA